ncbi:MAG TPA: hypothetical protein VJB35_03455 [Candidatus Nanoarchaeia archaeon]|nr:hypothetical protein [Candidatus Nanoarchaeia archaeon]
MKTTIQINHVVRDQLNENKIHPRESLNDVLIRILTDKSKTQNKIDKESLFATIEVLQDPQAMKEIKDALQETGGITLEDFEKELNL